DCDERIFHCRHSVDHSGLIHVGTPPGSRPGLISVAPQALQAAIHIEAAPRENLDIYFSATSSWHFFKSSLPEARTGIVSTRWTCFGIHKFGTPVSCSFLRSSVRL